MFQLRSSVFGCEPLVDVALPSVASSSNALMHSAIRETPGRIDELRYRALLLPISGLERVFIKLTNVRRSKSEFAP